MRVCSGMCLNEEKNFKEVVTLKNSNRNEICCFGSIREAYLFWQLRNFTREKIFYNKAKRPVVAGRF